MSKRCQLPFGHLEYFLYNRSMKKLLFKTTLESSNVNEFSLTFLRVLVGLTMAFSHGLGKVPPPEMLVQGVAHLGFPMPEFFAWAAGLSEFAGGILLALGLLTRPAAFFLSFTMLVAVLGVHWADPFSAKEMGLLFFTIFSVFVIRGSGKWSLDYLLCKCKR